jgi:hypothetical protein
MKLEGGPNTAEQDRIAGVCVMLCIESVRGAVDTSRCQDPKWMHEPQAGASASTRRGQGHMRSKRKEGVGSAKQADTGWAKVGTGMERLEGGESPSHRGHIYSRDHHDAKRHSLAVVAPTRVMNNPDTNILSELLKVW